MEGFAPLDVKDETQKLDNLWSNISDSIHRLYFCEDSRFLWRCLKKSPEAFVRSKDAFLQTTPESTSDASFLESQEGIERLFTCLEEELTTSTVFIWECLDEAEITPDFEIARHEEGVCDQVYHSMEAVYGEGGFEHLESLVRYVQSPQTKNLEQQMQYLANTPAEFLPHLSACFDCINENYVDSVRTMNQYVKARSWIHERSKWRDISLQTDINSPTIENPLLDGTGSPAIDTTHEIRQVFEHEESPWLGLNGQMDKDIDLALVHLGNENSIPSFGGDFVEIGVRERALVAMNALRECHESRSKLYGLLEALEKNSEWIFERGTGFSKVMAQQDPYTPFVYQICDCLIEDRETVEPFIKRYAETLVHRDLGASVKDRMFMALDLMKKTDLASFYYNFQKDDHFFQRGMESNIARYAGSFCGETKMDFEVLIEALHEDRHSRYFLAEYAIDHLRDIPCSERRSRRGRTR